MPVSGRKVYSRCDIAMPDRGWANISTSRIPFRTVSNALYAPYLPFITAFHHLLCRIRWKTNRTSMTVPVTSWKVSPISE